MELVERELPVEHLPESLLGSRMVQLSDLHIGRQVDDAYLIRTFDRVRALSPEIVVYTGDFVTYDAAVFEHARRMFAHLPLGRVATLGVLGNHDYGHGWSDGEVADQIAELAAAAGVRVLRNEIAEVAGLQIVGMDDLWAGRFAPQRALAGRKPKAAALVLSHNPDAADLEGWGEYHGWILSGHTHGGQCKTSIPSAPIAARQEPALHRGRVLVGREPPDVHQPGRRLSSTGKIQRAPGSHRVPVDPSVSVAYKRRHGPYPP